MDRFYLAGPMTGIPQFNFPAFDEAAEYLRGEGFVIFSPAEMDDAETRRLALASPDGAPGSASPNGETWGDFLARDVKIVADEVDAVVVLPGWDGSKGARLETFVARQAGKPVLRYPSLDVVDDEELDVAFSRLPNTTAGGEHRVRNLVEEGIEKFSTRDLRLGDLFSPPPKSEVAFGEVRVVNESTGGEKGSKLARFDLLPGDILWQLAEHYGKGAEKYEDRNWEKGYDWSLSFAALNRHLWAFWGGEDIDEETGSHHLLGVIFHAAALIRFGRAHPELDDRPVSA